jgi:hypothetical protein
VKYTSFKEQEPKHDPDGMPDILLDFLADADPSALTEIHWVGERHSRPLMPKIGTAYRDKRDDRLYVFVNFGSSQRWGHISE